MFLLFIYQLYAKIKFHFKSIGWSLFKLSFKNKIKYLYIKIESLKSFVVFDYLFYFCIVQFSYWLWAGRRQNEDSAANDQQSPWIKLHACIAQSQTNAQVFHTTSNIFNEKSLQLTPITKVFSDNNQTNKFSFQKERETPKMVYPPRPPIKSCPLVSRIRPRKASNGARMISNVNTSNNDNNANCCSGKNNGPLTT